MSDTTNTITPETRRMFMEDANAILAHDKKNLERRAAAEAILRLLNALEATEAKNARLRERLDAFEWLREVERYIPHIHHKYAPYREIDIQRHDKSKAYWNAAFEFDQIQKAAHRAVEGK